MQPRRGAGHVADVYDARDNMAASAPGLGLEDVPDRYFFEQVGASNTAVHEALLPLDQGDTSACVGFATTTAVRLVAALGSSPLPPLSPLSVYATARILDDNDMSDHGTRPRAALKAVQKYGVVSEDRWPFDPDMVTTPVPLDVIQAGVQARIDKYYRIMSTGEARLQELRRAIASGYVPVFGMDIDDAYDYLGNDDYVPGGAVRGSHYQCLIGYSARKFRVLNSWGSGWAQNGMGWLPNTWMVSDSIRDVYVFKLAPAAVY